MKRKKIEGIFLMLIATLIWGNSFVAQTSAADTLESFTFNACRSFTASIFLALLILCKNRKANENGSKSKLLDTEDRKNIWQCGILCGIALFFGFGFQQSGISCYSQEVAAAGRAGFLNSVQVIIVPLIEWCMGKKPRISLFISIGGVLFGMYLLCIKNGTGGLYLGDALVLLGAFAFGIYVILIGKCAGLDSIRFCFVQFFTCGVLSLLGALLTGSFDITDISDAAVSILYTGVLSSGLASVFQAIAQRNVEPTLVTLIVSLEAVIAALSGWIILGESLSGREITGCACVFMFVLFAQLQSLKEPQDRIKNKS